MFANGRLLGAHLPLGSGMVRAADRAAAIGATALQVFSDNPTSWRRREALPPELGPFRARLAQHGITALVIHAPYLVNLAASDLSVYERSVGLLATELRVAAAYGAGIVNVHIGSHRGDGPEAGIARLASGLRRVFDLAGAEAEDVILALENGSGSGFGLGATLEELATIDQAMAAAGVPQNRTGFCLDTAHLWGAGYPIDSPAGVDEFITSFSAGVGLTRLRLVHLNDSRAEGGSRNDRHEHLGAGKIGVTGLARLLVHPALDGLPYILETPGMDEGWDAVNMARARDMADGRPVAELPPEAFETRRARSAAPPDGAAEAGSEPGGEPG
jgi:deoxyribonuclease-4